MTGSNQNEDYFVRICENESRFVQRVEMQMSSNAITQVIHVQ